MTHKKATRSQRKHAHRSRQSRQSRRSHRPSRRRQTRRRVGGEHLSSQELLDAIARASEEIKQNPYYFNHPQYKEANDVLFDKIKDEFYKDTIPQMKKSDWYELVTIGSREDYATIKKRIDDILEVMRFWMTMRRRKTQNSSVGSKFSRFFKPNDRSKKLAETLKEVEVFRSFLHEYAGDAARHGSPYVSHYVREAKALTGEIEGVSME